MKSQPSQLFVTIAILGGILAVSTASIFIRFAQQDAPSLGVAAYRLALASLILAPLAWTRYRAELRSLTRREVWLGLLSGFFLALHFATWISSLEYTTVASSVVLVTTTPLWVAWLSPLILREPNGKTVVIGMLLALAGGAIVGISDSCTWQAGLVCPPLATFVRGMAAIVLVIILGISGQPAFGYQPLTYLWLLLLALVPQLLGHSTFNWALRYLPASLVSITLLGEPIGSTILAYLILKESPTALKIIGAVLILAGIYVASARESGSRKA